MRQIVVPFALEHVTHVAPVHVRECTLVQTGPVKQHQETVLSSE